MKKIKFVTLTLITFFLLVISANAYTPICVYSYMDNSGNGDMAYIALDKGVYKLVINKRDINITDDIYDMLWSGILPFGDGYWSSDGFDSLSTSLVTGAMQFTLMGDPFNTAVKYEINDEGSNKDNILTDITNTVLPFTPVTFGNDDHETYNVNFQNWDSFKNDFICPNFLIYDDMNTLGQTLDALFHGNLEPVIHFTNTDPYDILGSEEAADFFLGNYSFELTWSFFDDDHFATTSDFNYLFDSSLQSQSSSKIDELISKFPALYSIKGIHAYEKKVIFDFLVQKKGYKELAERLANELDPNSGVCFNANLEQCTRLHEIGEDFLLQFSNDYNIDVDSCEKILGNPDEVGTFAYYLQYILDLIKFIAPALVIGLTIYDYVGAITSNDSDMMKKCNSRLAKRLILAILLFILPFIIELILNTFAFTSGDCNIR